MAASTTKDGFPTIRRTETDSKGKTKTKVLREWKTDLTEYTDKSTAFTGPPKGYIGKCTKESKEIDFFMELFDDAANFIVTTTNTFMAEREAAAKRSKRVDEQGGSQQPQSPAPSVAVVADKSSDSAPSVAVVAGTSSDPVLSDDDTVLIDSDFGQDESSDGEYREESESDEDGDRFFPPCSSASEELFLSSSEEDDAPLPSPKTDSEPALLSYETVKGRKRLRIVLHRCDSPKPPARKRKARAKRTPARRGLNAMKQVASKLQRKLADESSQSTSSSSSSDILSGKIRLISVESRSSRVAPSPLSTAILPSPVPESQTPASSPGQSSPAAEESQIAAPSPLSTAIPPSQDPESQITAPSPLSTDILTPQEQESQIAACQSQIDALSQSSSSSSSYIQPGQVQHDQTAATSPATSDIQPSQVSRPETATAGQSSPAAEDSQLATPSPLTSDIQGSQVPRPEIASTSQSSASETSSKLKRKRAVAAWEPLTKEDLLSFVACMIIMGYDEQPEMANYWSMASDLGNHAIRTALTRTKFGQIWNNFRLSAEPSFTGVDLDTAPLATREAILAQKAKEDLDAIMKVRPLLEGINAKFRACRNPSSILCVDESMTAYKGRSKIKICQPKKPIKVGFEHFTLCDSDDGYILNDEAHIGKKRHMKVDPAQDPAKDLRSSKMAHTTIYTSRHYLNQGFTIVCDNRFTSAKLFQKLYQDLGTFGCGSLRSNAKDMPEDWSKDLRTYAQQEGVRRGDSTMRQSGRLLLTMWYDTKTVPLLSTHIDPKTPPGTVKRVISGQKRQVACPAPALTYTKSMNGVDMANHLVSSLHVGRRCRIWHRYLFFQKLNQVLVNARINMMTVVPNAKKVHRRSQLSFRRALATQLINLKSKPRPVRLPAVQGTKHVQEKHFKPARCDVCKIYRDERHETVWRCRTCRTHICSTKTSKRNCWALHLDMVDIVL